MNALYKKCLHYCSHFISAQSGIKPRKIYFQARRGSSGKTFICRIELVKSKEQSFIKFIKKGTKVKHKKTSLMGTLHSRADSILIADLDKKKQTFPYMSLTQNYDLTSPLF